MAAGNTLLYLDATTFVPGASTGPSPDEITAATGTRQVLDFDAAADEAAAAQALMPRHYGGGGITLRVWYAMDAANTTDDVVFTAAFERVEDGVALGAAGNDYADANSLTKTVPDTANEIDVLEIPFTAGADMDAVTAGDLFRLRLVRDADNVADTAAGDFQLVGVEVRETP